MPNRLMITDEIERVKFGHYRNAEIQCVPKQGIKSLRYSVSLRVLRARRFGYVNTIIREFRLAPIHISDGSFIVFIHNLKAGPRTAHVCSGIHEVIEITTQYNRKVISMQAYIDPYLQVMYAIKWRTEIIGYMDREDHPNRDISLLPLYMKVETIALQIRTVTEFIALAALAANKPLFEQEGDKFKEFWNAERIFRDIAEKNPDFYPKPIEPIHMTHIDNIDRNIRFIEDG